MADDERTLTTNITPFGLRMQPSLKAKIEEAARDSARSMNSEIVARLEDSFNDGSASELRQTIAKLQRALDAAKRAMDASFSSADATRAISEMYEREVLELQERLTQIAGVSAVVTAAIRDAAEGKSWDLQILFESLNPYRDDSIPKNPDALLQAQYEFGLARLADVPDDERPSAHAHLKSQMEASADLMGVEWSMPEAEK